MTSVLLILALGAFMAFYAFKDRPEPEEAKLPDKLSNQLDKLWQVASSSLKENKLLRAEKALLTILRVDEENAQAYNRLGILYVKRHQFKEAIECFEIAQSLDNNASSIHNVGLIYLETGDYDKAAQAFEQALSLDNSLPGRYVAYGKALRGLGNDKKAAENLEEGWANTKSPLILRELLHIYNDTEDFDNLKRTKQRIQRLLANKKRKLPKLAPKKRKVVM
jgi:tetratricopeptide (TPR) repeat protein